MAADLEAMNEAAPAVELSQGAQARMVCALRQRLADRLGAPVSQFETHISYVLVAGAHAYKIKKAIRTPFLDQSTLALRQHACREELRLNRRLAPQLYLSVLPVTGPCEQAELGGCGVVLDAAVCMRAFDQQGLWDTMAGRGQLGAAHIDALVTALGAFHASAAVAPPRGRLGAPAQVRAPLLQSLDELDGGAAAGLDREALRQLRAWEADTFVRLEPVMQQRLAEGRIRECHGDLHLGNVTQIEGRTTVFDGIEFNDDFRWIDVISELAFMAMDLQAHGLPELAHRFINGYLEFSGDYAGLAVLDYYLVHRALVRCKVAQERAAQCGPAVVAEAHRQRTLAADYLALALRLGPHRAARPRPMVLMTHGYSGSGKSTATRELIGLLGAVRIRSDVERKRLAGLRPLDRPGAVDARLLYQPRMTAATYSRLLELARLVVGSGRAVILDGTYLSVPQRDAVRALAAELGVGWSILDFDVDMQVLRERLRCRTARGDDPSDADEHVLEGQVRQAQDLQAHERPAVFACLQNGSSPNGVDWRPLLARLHEPRRDA